MRVIIAGSRDLTRYASVERAMSIAAEHGIIPFKTLSGTCRGADRLGERWASRHGITPERYPADWDTHGKAAGPIRNSLMATKADALVVFIMGSSTKDDARVKSRGSRDMLRKAQRAGLTCIQFFVDEKTDTLLSYSIDGKTLHPIDGGKS